MQNYKLPFFFAFPPLQLNITDRFNVRFLQTNAEFSYYPKTFSFIVTFCQMILFVDDKIF